MPVLMLQHGDFLMIPLLLLHPFFAKALLMLKSFVVLFQKISSEVPEDLVCGRAPSFCWRESVSMLSLSRRISGPHHRILCP